MVRTYVWRHSLSGTGGEVPFTQEQVDEALLHNPPVDLLTRAQALEIVNVWNRRANGAFVYWIPPGAV